MAQRSISWADRSDAPPRGHGRNRGARLRRRIDQVGKAMTSRETRRHQLAAPGGNDRRMPASIQPALTKSR
jgi:hypothetical protein